NDPMKKASVIKDIVNSIALIPDHITRSVYIQSCSNRLNIEERALKNELDKILRQSLRKDLKVSKKEVPESEPVAKKQTTAASGLAPQENEIMRLLLNYGSEEIDVPVTGEDGA